MDKRRNILDFGIVILIPLLLICISMKVWDMDFNVPVSTNGDAMLGLMQVKSIKENGLKGAWFNDRIGTPENSALIDCPFMDTMFILETWLLTKICPSEAAVLYVIYILSYVLAAITMYLLLKYIQANRMICITFSILYSFVPYHFIRGMGHLTLSIYYALPIGIMLALIVLQEDFRGYFPKKCVKNVQNG